MATSTLAGEYATARDYVGGRASCGNFETSTPCIRRGIRGEAMWDDVRVVEEGGVGDYGTRGRDDPPTWFHCSFFVFCLLCQGKGGQRSTRARGTLSEAKTQRRPHSARERVRGVVSFVVVFVSLF